MVWNLKDLYSETLSLPISTCLTGSPHGLPGNNAPDVHGLLDTPQNFTI